jgi:hypothetical protein
MGTFAGGGLAPYGLYPFDFLGASTCESLAPTNPRPSPCYACQVMDSNPSAGYIKRPVQRRVFLYGSGGGIIPYISIQCSKQASARFSRYRTRPFRPTGSVSDISDVKRKRTRSNDLILFLWLTTIEEVITIIKVDVIACSI